MPAVCPLCHGTRTVVGEDVLAPCPFHDGAVLVSADPAALAALRSRMLAAARRGSDNLVSEAVDWTRQHQLEPAGLTTPTRHEILPGTRRPPLKRNPWLSALGTVLLALAAGALGLAVLEALARIFS